MQNLKFFKIWENLVSLYFHGDYIIRNISFWFEFINLKIDTWSFLDSMDFSLYVSEFKVSLWIREIWKWTSLRADG